MAPSSASPEYWHKTLRSFVGKRVRVYFTDERWPPEGLLSQDATGTYRLESQHGPLGIPLGNVTAVELV